MLVYFTFRSKFEPRFLKCPFRTSFLSRTVLALRRRLVLEQYYSNMVRLRAEGLAYDRAGGALCRSDCQLKKTLMFRRHLGSNRRKRGTLPPYPFRCFPYFRHSDQFQIKFPSFCSAQRHQQVSSHTASLEGPGPGGVRSKRDQGANRGRDGRRRDPQVRKMIPKYGEHSRNFYNCTPYVSTQ